MTSQLLAPRPEISRVDDDAVEAAVDRLAAEFRHRLGPQYIRRIVELCRNDLSGVPEGAVPELVERLARHRLTSA